LNVFIILTKYGKEEVNDWAISFSSCGDNFDSEAPLRISWPSAFPLLFRLAASVRN